MNEGREAREYSGRTIAFESLMRIVNGGAYSNIISRKLPAGNGHSPGSRRAAVNLIYGVLRNITLIDEVLKSKSDRKKLKLSPDAMMLSRMAAYELLYMDNVPEYASVSEYINIAKTRCSRGETGFMNAVLKKISKDDIDTLLDGTAGEAQREALKYSHPAWFVEKLIHAYGAGVANEMLAADNTPQPVYFRMNPSKKELYGEAGAGRLSGIEWIESPPDCAGLGPGGGEFPHDEYNKGILTAQDRSSQYAAYFAAPAGGEKILDMCCGSGIKTAQMAEKAPGAVITAADIHRKKLESVASEFARLGLDGKRLNTLCGDMTKENGRGDYDCVLLDAPCSGAGTLRRKPELKMRITQRGVRELASLQDRLLDAAATHVRPGGRIIYSTCSILPEENGERINDFTARNTAFRNATVEICATMSFSLEQYIMDEAGVTFLPQATGGCGGFVSVLMRY